jgi:hypothetical protein
VSRSFPSGAAEPRWFACQIMVIERHMAGVDLPCELVCTSVPSHVEEGLELVGDIWNGLVITVSWDDSRSPSYQASLIANLQWQ